MSTAYTRRVSFDSLNPSIQVEPDEPIHIPPQYNSSARASTSSKRTLDLNFGYEPSSKHQDLYKVFDSFQEINNKGYKSNLSTTRRKIPKLPPPPNKSILKRSVDDVQDQGAAIPKSFNENDQQNSFASVLPSQQRKKSLVEMTAEELLAMDAQFRTGVNLDEFKFDGDNYLPFHNLSSIDSKKPKNGLPNIDKLVGNIVTVNNRKLLKTNSINFNSYTVSFRHRLMTKFIDQIYEGFETDEEEDDDEDERPESLRELIVYISGRRHTWDSINWVLKNFLVDGDHLVIISQLPPENNSNVDYKDELIDCDFIKSKADALSSYIFKAIELLNKQDLKISITIEFIKDSSVKNLIKNSINLYNPNFFIISSLISNRLSIRFENNHVKLPYYLMKNLNLSTIIIPDLLVEKTLVSLDQNIPETNIETDDEDYITTSYFLNSLNQISDAYKTIELNQLKSDISLSSTSNSNSNSNSNSRSDSRSTNQANNQEYADTPTNYYPKIKFSDNLSIPKYNNSNPSNSSSPFSSRRNSNNSSGIYKVKSLLDDPIPNNIQRSKSYNSTPITNTISNVSNSEKKLPSNVVKKSKSIDEGSIKKSGFFSKFGFKKK